MEPVTLQQWMGLGNEAIFGIQKMWFWVPQSTIHNEELGWTSGGNNRLWLKVS